jgi:hypothetical protein
VQGQTAAARQQEAQQQARTLRGQLKTAAASASYTSPRVSFPHGVLTAGVLVPTIRKLPFLALGLVGLAIVLLALGALPAGVAPHPVFAELLVDRRLELALGGLLTLVASIAAYLLA